MKKLILVSVLLFMLCGCGREKYTASYYDIFDTLSTVTIYCESEEEFNEISEELHNKLLRLNRLFDIYNDYDGINNIKTINDNAGIAPVKVDNEIIELISQGIDAYDITEGNINIALGSVLEIWHNYRDNALDNEIYAIPSEEELKTAALHCDINSIVIDNENSTVYITDKNTSIDVGAIAKGYAADFAAKFLKEKGIGAAMVNLGGNLIVINDNEKPSFRTGVTSPDDTEEYAAEIDLSNQSAVTSGNYQRYYEYEGKRYHHIIDGKTLFPADYNRAVTVIDDSSLKGDIFSTALFILPYEEGKALAEKNNIEAMWIDVNGQIYKTDNFR